MDEIKKYTIHNIADKSGTVPIRSLASFDSVTSGVIKAIKSVVPNGDIVGISNKVVDPNTGLASLDVYVVDRGNGESVNSAFSYVMGKRDTKKFYGMESAPAVVTTGKITLHGKEAQKNATEVLKGMGGTLSAGAKADTFIYSVPVGTDVENPKELIRSNLQTALSSSYDERRKQKKIEEAKSQERELKEIVKDKKEKDKVNDKLNKLVNDAVNDDNKKDKKEQLASSALNKSHFLKTISILTSILAVTRHILTSVLNTASQAVQDARDAGDLGISYNTVRKFGMQEKVLGIKQGTLLGALGDIQSKFGNITSLDEKSLGALALVMGGDITDLIQSGLGGDNPEELMNLIIDSFANKALSGYNSIGQYVGDKEARRELVEYLKKISPNLAELLSVFLENKMNDNSIFRSANSFGGMLGMADFTRGGITQVEYDLVQTAGMYTKEISGLIEALKQGIRIKLSDKLVDLLERLAQSRVGMSALERQELDEDNKIKNRSTLARLSSKRQDINNKMTKKINSTLKGNSILKGMTFEQLYDVVINKNKASLPSGVYYADALTWFNNLMTDSEFSSSVSDYLGIDFYTGKLKEEQKKTNGIDFIDATDSRIRYKGTNELKSMYFKSSSYGRLSDVEISIVEKAFAKAKESYKDSGKDLEAILRSSPSYILAKRSGLEDSRALREAFYDFTDDHEHGVLRNSFNPTIREYLDAEIERQWNSSMDWGKAGAIAGSEATLAVNFTNNGEPLGSRTYKINSYGSIREVDNLGESFTIDLAQAQLGNV